jgi:glycerol-3-phosphate dehydrogenase
MLREQILTSLSSNPQVDVLIVGGGINGIGTFRDLALQGVNTLLIERSDFCSGASAASSHMAHGGIRYLENGEFRLVREAVQERNRMLQNAPHLVKPLPTAIPIFKRFSGLLNAPLKFLGLLERPAERGALVIKLGLMLYDSYTGKTRQVPSHRFYNRRQSLQRWPHLNPNILYTATYYDGAILSPERYAIELLLDAEAEGNHARALNYVSLIGGKGKSVFLRDELTGQEYEVRPRLLINASGAWIDRTNGSLGLRTHFIGGTKGSHLILDHPQLRQAIGDYEFFFENDDGRIVLIFPLFDKVLVGTSDIPIEDPDQARCTEEEVEYFLHMIGRVFPGIRVGREHIVFRFSGVRPLAFTRAHNPGQITRDHHIQVVPEEWSGLSFPIYSLVGGKWTSYRAFSEQVTDRALSFLQRPRRKDTRTLPVGGGRGYPKTSEERQQCLKRMTAWSGLPLAHLEMLCDRYGMRAEDVVIFLSHEADTPLRSLPDYTQREIAFLVQHEKVVHLDDLLLRRTSLAKLGRLSQAAVEEIASVAARAAGWGAERTRSEIERLRRILQERHQVTLS